MLEIKIDTKKFVNAMLVEAQDILKDEIKNQINDYDIWDNEEINKQVDRFFQDLIKEILEENKEKIKKDVETAIMELAKEIALDNLAEKLS